MQHNKIENLLPAKCENILVCLQITNSPTKKKKKWFRTNKLNLIKVHKEHIASQLISKFKINFRSTWCSVTV